MRYKPSKRSSVVIVKEQNQWILRIAVNIGLPGYCVTKRAFGRLVEALDAANILRLHIDNAHKLPLNQYYKAA